MTIVDELAIQRQFLEMKRRETSLCRSTLLAVVTAAVFVWLRVVGSSECELKAERWPAFWWIEAKTDVRLLLCLRDTESSGGKNIAGGMSFQTLLPQWYLCPAASVAGKMVPLVACRCRSLWDCWGAADLPSWFQILHFIREKLFL